MAEYGTCNQNGTGLAVVGGILFLLSFTEQVTFILSKDNYLILQSLFLQFSPDYWF